MGRNYAENSLKKFLKRKVKITMGFVVAFMITGSVGYGEIITNQIIKDASKIESQPQIFTDGIDINVKGSIESGKTTAGIFLDSQSETEMDYKKRHDYTFLGKELNVTIDTIGYGNTLGISAYRGSKITLGNKETNTIKILMNVESNLAIGLDARYNKPHGGTENAIGAKVTVNSKDLIININNKNKSNGTTTVGVWGATSNNFLLEELEKKENYTTSKIELNSENTYITVTADAGEVDGIVAYSNAVIDVKGNLYLKTKSGNELGNALSIRGNSVTNINENNNKTVVLEGNIIFEHTDTKPNGEKNTTVNLNLSNKDSYFTGKIYTLNQYKDLEYSKNNGMLLSLSNEAQWNNTGNSFVTDLKLDNGIINNNSVNNDIKVKNLKGTGGAINMAAEIGDDGKATSGELNIGEVENKNARFAVNYKGTDNLEVGKDEAEKVFGELAENIKVENGEFNAIAKLEEGFVSSEYVSELVKDEKGNVVVKEDSVKIGNLNSMVEGMKDLATINLLTWRQEMNSLNKRMGELRNSTGEHGIWSRVYTGKIENGSKYDNDYQTYQVGYDKKYTVDNGVMFVGGLVSYTDGETDYALGHGENYSVGAGIYATWLNNDGQFADVVLKQSRLHNKFDVRSKDLDKSQSGDYNNWGTSLSGQYGKRFDLNDKFFVEPSIELTLGRVDDTTYTTSAGVDVHQDTMYSLVGNVGTSVGYKFNDKGNVYARAALVKEFQGDIDTEYEKDGAFERTSEDLGDTWAEFGVGVNYRFVENMNIYVDIQKTGEATVDNKWQANLGFRYEF